MFAIFKRIRRSLISWASNEQDISINDLLKQYTLDTCDIPDYNGNKKFIGVNTQIEHFVKTPTGYSPVKKLLKTIQYQEYNLTLANGKTLSCADEHIVIDETGAEVYVKNLKEHDAVMTDAGPSKVISVIKSNTFQNMYDLELDDDHHVFYTNGILSHNTTVIAAYLLWYACFKADKNVLVASNKNTNAMDIMSRIIYAYEELPDWLKPGAKYATKHSLEFDNGSAIRSQATTASTGRGSAVSLLMLDELAFVPRRIQDEMWTSVAPTLSNGGSCIISSTPNGDQDLFAKLWRVSELELETDDLAFKNLFVEWHEHPDRDETFRRSMIAKIGELKFRQEYACVSGDTFIHIEYDGKPQKITIGDLYELLYNQE